jgi:sugar transferase (PEP-CTERM/EpsH1 system associated)
MIRATDGAEEFQGAMRVAHVVHSLSVGGIENGLVNLVRGLPPGRFRHTVIVMTETGAMAGRLPGEVDVWILGKRAGLDLSAVGRLTRLLWRARPHIVHSRNWGAIDAVLAARLAGVPCVIHGEHGRAITDLHGLSPRRNRARRVLAPLVDRFVTVSFDLRRWLVDVVGIADRKVTTIHNGVDTTRFCDDNREEARRALGVPDHAFVVGTVGRLDPVKDQLGLLEAFARLGDRHPAAVLVVVGDGPLQTALATRIQQPDLAGRVRLLGERHDVPRLLKAFDLFVLPSLGEGLANTLLEAIATGLPVVATRVGGNPEVVADGVNGRVVPAGDPLVLADAIGTYLDDPVLRTLHGKASRERAVEYFNLPRMATAYGELYLTVARGRKEPR